jgi:hypothetical protein
MPLLPYPEHITLKRWAAELIRIYPKDRLPILLDEEKWQEWANMVASTGTFKRNNIPGGNKVVNNDKQDLFKDWQSWAKSVYSIMINAKEMV